MSDFKSDVSSATGWVKTHTMLAACLACLILGAVAGHFLL